MGTLQQTAKAVLRHALHTARVMPLVRKLRGQEMPHLSGDVATRFTRIYETALWRHGREDIPPSGHGSSLEATHVIRAALPDLLRDLKTETLLDVGCGDFTWMSATPVSCRYIGVDVAPSIIEANRAKHARNDRTFLAADAIRDELPDADTILCREVLFHLSLADGRALIRNLLAKPRGFIIATSDASTLFNSDVETGDFRALNLREAPFRFPEPEWTIQDSAVASDRSLSVWRAESLRR
jgi:SAM-dependent methyltransferase